MQFYIDKQLVAIYRMELWSRNTIKFDSSCNVIDNFSVLLRTSVLI